MTSTFHRPRQRCGARLSHGRGYCRQYRVAGRKRCKWHGGLSTGPLSVEGAEASIQAMREGLHRYWARIQWAKAKGLIDRAPQGRKRKGHIPIRRT